MASPSPRLSNQPAFQVNLHPLYLSQAAFSSKFSFIHSWTFPPYRTPNSFSHTETTITKLVQDLIIPDHQPLIILHLSLFSPVRHSPENREGRSILTSLKMSSISSFDEKKYMPLETEEKWADSHLVSSNDEFHIEAVWQRRFYTLFASSLLCISLLCGIIGWLYIFQTSAHTCPASKLDSDVIIPYCEHTPSRGYQC